MVIFPTIMGLLFKAAVCAQLKQDEEVEKCLNKIAEINPAFLFELDNILQD